MADTSFEEEADLELQPHSREKESLLSTSEVTGRISTTSTVGVRTISHSLRALFCLDQQHTDTADHDEDRHHDDDAMPPKISVIGGIVGCWVILVLWFLTGWMGPGVRYLIMVELPGAALFYTAQFAICIFLFKRFRGFFVARVSAQNNKKYWCCILVGAWVGVSALLQTIPPWIECSDCDFGFWLMWVVVPVLYGMHWLLQRIVRAFHRQVQEEDPSPQFWQRLDKCLVNLLRCLGFLVAIGYVVWTYSFLDMRLYLFELLWEFFMITLCFAAHMYLLVATLAVHDGGINNSQRFDEHLAMRRTRQFVMNPNDPLGEPLLLV